MVIHNKGNLHDLEQLAQSSNSIDPIVNGVWLYNKPPTTSYIVPSYALVVSCVRNISSIQVSRNAI